MRSGKGSREVPEPLCHLRLALALGEPLGMFGDQAWQQRELLSPFISFCELILKRGPTPLTSFKLCSYFTPLVCTQGLAALFRIKCPPLSPSRPSPCALSRRYPPQKPCSRPSWTYVSCLLICPRFSL